MTVSQPDAEPRRTGAEVDEFLVAPTEVPPPTQPAAQEAATWPAKIPAALGATAGLDKVVDVVDRVASTVTAPPMLRAVLRGDWLGHPLHPLLTDITIGFWTSASALDVLGGRRARPAARTMVALGLVSMPLTAAAGLADFTGMRAAPSRRVAAVHAAGNAAATGVYFTSWWARRRGRHGLGTWLALGGAAVATVTGYLGGHLVFADGEERVD